MTGLKTGDGHTRQGDRYALAKMSAPRDGNLVEPAPQAGAASLQDPYIGGILRRIWKKQAQMNADVSEYATPRPE
jgi:hypothetical protein